MRKSFLIFFCLLASCSITLKKNLKVSFTQQKQETKLEEKPLPQKTAKRKEKRQEVKISQSKIKWLNNLFGQAQIKPLTKKQEKKLNQMLQTSKKSSISSKILMTLGKHYTKKLLYKKALTAFQKIKEPQWRAEALLESAKIYHKIKQPSEALSLFRILINEEELSQELLIKAYQLKLSVLLENKSSNQKEILKVYSQLLENENKAIYSQKMRRLILEMKESDLFKIKDENFLEPIQGLVFFLVGKTFFYREKFDRALSFFKKSLRFSEEGDLERKTIKYIQAIESRKKVRRKLIGAVLPLSGPSQRIGKRSLRGLQMGLGLYAKEKTIFQLVILDSQGQVDKARKAVEKLVTKYHVIGIVGGVLSRTAQVIAEEAQNFGIPSILTSQKAELTKVGRYVFQNGLTSHLVIDRLVSFLMNQLNFKRFAILYPNDPYGVDYANAFWSSVEKKGGSITGAQVYKPKQTDFNGPIRRLIGTYYVEDRLPEYKKKLKAWFEKTSYSYGSRVSPPNNILSPILDFQALFIPDSSKVLNLIAPHIAYNDIEDLYLVGTNLWNQERHKNINQAFFADIGLSEESFKKSDFYQKFHSIFKQKPGLFELQAYEATLVLRQVIAGGANTRNDLREDLSRLKKFQGPLGEILITKNREFTHQLKIFEIENGVIQLFSKTRKLPQ